MTAITQQKHEMKWILCTSLLFYRMPNFFFCFVFGIKRTNTEKDKRDPLGKKGKRNILSIIIKTVEYEGLFESDNSMLFMNIKKKVIIHYYVLYIR